MNLKPLKPRVILMPLEAEARTKGGIYIPDEAKEKRKEADVVEVYEGEDKDYGKCPVKKGDRVVYDTYSSTEYKQGDKKYLIVDIKDIVAVVQR